MPKHSRMDTAQNALRVVEQTIGEQLSTQPKKKDPLAVELGRRGGLKGGVARAAKMTPKQRTESARKAAKGRWNKPQTDIK
jgi:hypothetical protein